MGNGEFISKELLSGKIWGHARPNAFGQPFRIPAQVPQNMCAPPPPPPKNK